MTEQSSTEELSPQEMAQELEPPVTSQHSMTQLAPAEMTNSPGGQVHWRKSHSVMQEPSAQTTARPEWLMTVQSSTQQEAAQVKASPAQPVASQHSITQRAEKYPSGQEHLRKWHS